MTTRARGQFFWVSPGDPWSQWTNSGYIRKLCLELKARGRLWGAMTPSTRSLRFVRGPGPLYDLRSRIAKHLGRGPLPRAACDERSGRLAEALRQLPEGTNVVYHYMYPEIDPSLPIRRWLFQDLTVRDAVESGGYGHEGLSDEHVRDRTERQRGALEAADGVVTFSSHNANSLNRDYGYPLSKIAVIGAGPVRAPRRIDLSRRRYEQGRLLFVGRQWERKGGPFLLEAFGQVRKAVPHATLTIVGARIDPPNQEGVINLGPVSNRRVRTLFAESSLFCMPARCETWGLVYVEAAQAGLPIVGFNAWAMPDIVVDGETGRLIDQRDPKELASAIELLLRAPDDMRSMGRKAQQRVEDYLGWPKVVERLLSFVDSCPD